jgi:hypothetical protein
MAWAEKRNDSLEIHHDVLNIEQGIRQIERSRFS